MSGQATSKSVTRRAVLAGGVTTVAGITLMGPTSVQTQQTNPTGKLKNKVAFITGAGRGIGRATAIRFAREGADVVALDIARNIATAPYPMATAADLAETERLVRAEGRKCLSVRADVRDMGQMRQAVQRAIQELGKIDILFSNAGIATKTSPLVSITDAQWRDVLEVNLFGTANALRAVLPHMVERKTGSIVANASVGARMGTPEVPNYGAAKWGMIGLVKTAAREVGKSGVRVNAVCPTFVNTVLTTQGTSLPDMPNPTFADLDKAAREVHALDVGIIEPEEVASAVLFLVSDDARFLTGEVLDVAAGSNAGWPA